MSKSSKYIDNIRTYINRPEVSNRLIDDINKWNIICAGIDVLEQTFESINFANRMKLPPKIGGQFLYITGLLQTLFIQQDVVSGINHVLFGEKINWEKDYPQIKEIRDHRNTLIGHPINRENGKKLKCSHLCISNSNDKTQYIIYNQHSTKFESINLKIFIKAQETIIQNILKNIVVKINDERSNFVNKFKDIKMIDIFKGYDYDKEKLRTEQSSYVQLMILPEIEGMITNMKNQLDQRYLSWTKCPCSDEIRDVDFCIDMLKSNCEKVSEDVRDIVYKHYADYLCFKLDELYNIAKDYDKYL